MHDIFIDIFRIFICYDGIWSVGKIWEKFLNNSGGLRLGVMWHGLARFLHRTGRRTPQYKTGKHLKFNIFNIFQWISHYYHEKMMLKTYVKLSSRMSRKPVTTCYWFQIIFILQAYINRISKPDTWWSYNIWVYKTSLLHVDLCNINNESATSTWFQHWHLHYI